jgi:hypothetical protein
MLSSSSFMYVYTYVIQMIIILIPLKKNHEKLIMNTPK